MRFTLIAALDTANYDLQRKCFHDHNPIQTTNIVSLYIPFTNVLHEKQHRYMSGRANHYRMIFSDHFQALSYPFKLKPHKFEIVLLCTGLSHPYHYEVSTTRTDPPLF